jgi:hypothetical protein
MVDRALLLPLPRTGGAAVSPPPAPARLAGGRGRRGEPAAANIKHAFDRDP